MKKILLGTLFLALVVSLNATNWKSLKYQNLLQFQLPENYTIEDTQGVVIYFGIDSIAEYKCMVSAMKGKAPTGISNLEAYYEKFFEGILGGLGGCNVASKKFVTEGNLYGHRASLNCSFSGVKYSIEVYTVIVKNKFISFTAAMPDGSGRSEKDYFNSIHFNEALTMADQMAPAISANVSADAYGRLLGVVLMAGVIIIIILVATKKKKTNTGTWG